MAKELEKQEISVSVQVESANDVLAEVGVRHGMTIDEITETIKKVDTEILSMKQNIGKRMFAIGVLLKDVRDRKITGVYTDDKGKVKTIKVEDWAEKTFGYKRAYTLGLIKVATNFNAELCDKYGTSKLIQIGTPEHLEKLEKEQGVTEYSTLADIKEAIKAEKAQKEPKAKTAEQLEREQERHEQALKVAIENLVKDGKNKDEIRKMVEAFLG